MSLLDKYSGASGSSGSLVDQYTNQSSVGGGGLLESYGGGMASTTSMLDLVSGNKKNFNYSPFGGVDSTFGTSSVKSNSTWGGSVSTFNTVNSGSTNTFDTLGSRTSFGASTDLMSIRSGGSFSFDMSQMFNDPQIAAKLQELGVNQFNIQNLDPASLQALQELIADGGLMAGGSFMGSTARSFQATNTMTGMGNPNFGANLGAPGLQGASLPGQPNALGGAPVSAFQKADAEKTMKEGNIEGGLAKMMEQIHGRAIDSQETFLNKESDSYTNKNKNLSIKSETTLKNEFLLPGYEESKNIGFYGNQDLNVNYHEAFNQNTDTTLIKSNSAGNMTQNIVADTGGMMLAATIQQKLAEKRAQQNQTIQMPQALGANQQSAMRKVAEAHDDMQVKKAVEFALNPMNRFAKNPHVTPQNEGKVVQALQKELNKRKKEQEEKELASILKSGNQQAQQASRHNETNEEKIPMEIVGLKQKEEGNVSAVGAFISSPKEYAKTNSSKDVEYKDFIDNKRKLQGKYFTDFISHVEEVEETLPIPPALEIPNPHVEISFYKRLDIDLNTMSLQELTELKKRLNLLFSQVGNSIDERNIKQDLGLIQAALARKMI
ncbi:hypothetical protein ACHJH3_06390 [Campylobacter sp. MOP7]|uniref:hypothetical protein n=1 Tax=Campylobacter canis TaxID=3378588 RepID=UPI00387E91E0